MSEIFIATYFVIIFVFVLFTTLRLLPMAGISLRRFSIPSLFVISYLMFSYIGIVPLFFELDAYAVSHNANDKIINFKLLAYSSLSLLLVVFGFSYANRVYGLRLNNISHHKLISATKSQHIWCFALFLLCIAIFLAYISQVETVAINIALQDDSSAAAVARSNMGNAFAGAYWRYHLFFRTLLDYCVYFFFANHLIQRGRVSSFYFALAVSAASITAVVAIEKAPLADLIISLYLVYVIYKGGHYLQPAAKFMGIVLISILTTFYSFFMGAPNILFGLQSVFRRITMGQILPAYFYIRLFPNSIDYLWGASLPNPGGLLPFDPYPLTVRVAQIIFPLDAANGVVGSAPTVFWGEMYANFGILGIIVSSPIVGIWLSIIWKFLSKQSLSPVTIAATVSLAMHYRTLTITSLSNYMVDARLVAIATVTFLLISIGHKRYGSVLHQRRLRPHSIGESYAN